jgi:TPR repeat protein
MYLNGQGVPADAKWAIEWFTKAIDAGSADAMSILGVTYLDGKAVSENAIMKQRDCGG